MQGFVVGVSGGIDSAVTSTLCAKTGIKLLCLEMPIMQELSQDSRASDHINWLKKNFKNVSSSRIPLAAYANRCRAMQYEQRGYRVLACW